MSDDARPAYLRGRGSRGRGTPAAGDRSIQGPGRQNTGRRNQSALSTDSRLSQRSATSDSGGNSAHKLPCI